MTCLCTQLTYEGLIDEVVGIRNGAVLLPDASSAPGDAEAGPSTSSGTGKGGGGRGSTRVTLSSADRLYSELRDLGFPTVGRMLKDRAAQIQQGYQSLTPEASTVTDMKAFVKQLNALPELTRHTDLAQLLQQATHEPAFVQQVQAEQALLEGADGALQNLEASRIQGSVDTPYLHAHTHTHTHTQRAGIAAVPPASIERWNGHSQARMPMQHLRCTKEMRDSISPPWPAPGAGALGGRAAAAAGRAAAAVPRLAHPRDRTIQEAPRAAGQGARAPLWQPAPLHRSATSFSLFFP